MYPICFLTFLLASVKDIEKICSYFTFPGSYSTSFSNDQIVTSGRGTAIISRRHCSHHAAAWIRLVCPGPQLPQGWARASGYPSKGEFSFCTSKLESVRVGPLPSPSHHRASLERNLGTQGSLMKGPDVCALGAQKSSGRDPANLKATRSLLMTVPEVLCCILPMRVRLPFLVDEELKFGETGWFVHGIDVTELLPTPRYGWPQICALRSLPSILPSCQIGKAGWLQVLVLRENSLFSRHLNASKCSSECLYFSFLVSHFQRTSSKKFPWGYLSFRWFKF